MELLSSLMELLSYVVVIYGITVNVGGMIRCCSCCCSCCCFLFFVVAAAVVSNHQVFGSACG